MNGLNGETHARPAGAAARMACEPGEAGGATTVDESGPARLTQVLLSADGSPSMGDRFLDTVLRAARQVGCEFLFEVPSVLFGPLNSRAAALRDGADGADGDAGLFFVLLSEREAAVSIVEAAEVSDNVVDFTRSYAGVLSLIGNDQRIVTPLLQ
ncbi:MAG: hypothetical protein BroJett030_19730 [Alphaproteobacteria bacterium]|nr:MAG: hypothetical protein BroJett030_19730 [Alphaproteobacteria bacterium]